MEARVEVLGDKALLEGENLLTPAIVRRPVVEHLRKRALGPALTVLADFLAVLLRLAAQGQPVGRNDTRMQSELFMLAASLTPPQRWPIPYTFWPDSSTVNMMLQCIAGVGAAGLLQLVAAKALCFALHIAEQVCRL
eukprot:4522126-Pleurochrysis_carterae.AAC.1